jgi:hypothetical protein
MVYIYIQANIIIQTRHGIVVIAILFMNEIRLTALKIVQQ